MFWNVAGEFINPNGTQQTYSGFHEFGRQFCEHSHCAPVFGGNLIIDQCEKYWAQ